MANYTVETTPVQINATQTALIQSLGPGMLYVGATSAVSTLNGLRLAPGEAVSVGASALYGVSDTSSDVRTLIGASGIHAAADPVA